MERLIDKDRLYRVHEPDGSEDGDNTNHRGWYIKAGNVADGKWYSYPGFYLFYSIDPEEEKDAGGEVKDAGGDTPGPAGRKLRKVKKAVTGGG